MKKKQQQEVRTYRLCILGPSFVGKTQLINRFINNSFSPYYDPTLRARVYKRTINLLEDQDQGEIISNDLVGASSVSTQFVTLELIDVFPHDHPALNDGTVADDTTPSGDFDSSSYMTSTLNALVKNNLESLPDVCQVPQGKSTIQHRIHGYLYVYDASNRNTWETLKCMIETVREIERSERRGQKNIVFTPIKIIIGNKRDLLSRKISQQNQIDKQEFQKLEVRRHKLVSAMTNAGVQEAFRAIINDLHSDNVLQKEFFELDKRKKSHEGNGDPSSLEQPRSTIIYGRQSIATPQQPAPPRGGLLSLIPFFNCANPRDDIHLEDEDDEREEEGQDEDLDIGDIRKKRQKMRQTATKLQTSTTQGQQGCLIM